MAYLTAVSAIAETRTMEVVLLFWIVFAILGGALGATKGRAGEGAALGLLLGPLGILIVPALKSQKELNKKGTKVCPHCAERVAVKAKVCKHCQKGVESFKCPYCKVRMFKSPAMRSGGQFPCPKCSKTVTAPADGENS